MILKAVKTRGGTRKDTWKSGKSTWYKNKIMEIRVITGTCSFYDKNGEDLNPTLV